MPAQPKSAAGEFAAVRVTLRDGRSVTIRAIRPDDAAALQAAFARLSPEARYTRFMAALAQPPPATLQRAVHPVADRDRALVAVTDEGVGGTIVGSARYLGTPDGESCEFAVTVADDWRAVGLASRMMKELVRDARARGLKRMEGFVLAANKPMLDLARHLGFEVAASREDPSLRLVRLDLAQSSGAGT
jgi:RimJ/RimL family protein N-acetyltransferase